MHCPEMATNVSEFPASEMLAVPVTGTGTGAAADAALGVALDPLRHFGVVGEGQHGRLVVARPELQLQRDQAVDYLDKG